MLCDSWGSTDGSTWALIAGYTLTYTAGGSSSSSIVGATGVTSPSQPGTTANTYYGNAGGSSLKCWDRVSGRMYMFSATTTFSPYTFSTLDGVNWANMSAGFTVSPRQQSACAIDSSSRIFIVQGANAAGANLNDV